MQSKDRSKTQKIVHLPTELRCCFKSIPSCSFSLLDEKGWWSGDGEEGRHRETREERFKREFCCGEEEKIDRAMTTGRAEGGFWT